MTRWIVIAVALAIGFALVAYDARTDDTGVEATVLLAVALALTLAAPRAALAIALGVALPMAALNGSFAALAFSGLGALIGYALRRGTGGSLSRAG